jgi:hypothetical protein
LHPPSKYASRNDALFRGLTCGSYEKKGTIVKKHLLLAAGFATLLAGASLSSSPAQASWAESAQGNPVYTGTNRSLYRSERTPRHFYRHGYGWDRGYYGYGAYEGYGPYGGVYGGYDPY